MPNTPLPPIQADTQASATASSSSSSSSKGESLMPTLSRLSQSTSRPTISSEKPDQGITQQTMKIGKEAWRRSGISSLWKSNNNDSDYNNKVRSDESSSRNSIESNSTITSKLRSQPLDTSSILYPTLTVHPPPVNHNILVLSLSHVSLAPPTLSNDELFNIILRRLEPWVGEEGEGGYVLIVMADEEGNENSQGQGKGKEKEKEERKLPGVGWWVWRWKRLPRKYRKNLKRLYIVHPSLFTRTLLPFILPFISPKSYAKLHPLPSLLSLYHSHGCSLKAIEISMSALTTEAQILRDRPDLIPSIPTKTGLDDRPPLKRVDSESSLASWGYQTISSAMETAVSYLPLPNFGMSGSYHPIDKVGQPSRKGYWGRDLEGLLQDCNGDIPPLVVNLRKVILRACINTEGVFRRSSNSPLLPVIIAMLDLPINQQPNLPWIEMAKRDPLLPPKMLTRFLKDMDGPLLRTDLYDVIRSTTTLDDIKTKLIPSLSSSTNQLLSYIIHILHHLSIHHDQTKMNPLNLSIILSSVLISGPDPIADTILCLEPSKPLPVGLKAMAEKKGLKQGAGTLVGLLELWIRHYARVSEEREDSEVQNGYCGCSWGIGGMGVS